MNILSIIIKEIKQNLRDKKAMSMMVIFPIVLIAILGMALNSWFSEGTGTNLKVDAVYCIQSKSILSDNFEKNIVNDKNGIDVKYTKSDNADDAMKSIANGKHDCLVLIDGNNIKLIKNSKYNNINASLVETILNVFVKKYNTVLEIAKVNPAALSTISSESPNYIEDVSLQKNKAPRAVDYYAITMLTLIIMYGGDTSMSAIISERKSKTQNRILCSPVKKHQYLIGKILGDIFVTIIQSLIVILFSKYVLKTYWGSSIGAVFAVILSVILFSITLGAGLTLIIKDNNIAGTLLSLIIPIFVFLGGGYFPLTGFNSKLLNIISKVSPITWSNQAILNIIYSNDFSTMLYAILINVIASVLLIGASAYIFKKEEA